MTLKSRTHKRLPTKTAKYFQKDKDNRGLTSVLMEDRSTSGSVGHIDTPGVKRLGKIALLKPLVIAGALALSLVAPQSADASGLVKTTTTTYTYDAYGNATRVDSSVTDGTETFSTSVVSTIQNDEAKWLLGRATSVTSTSINSD